MITWDLVPFFARLLPKLVVLPRSSGPHLNVYIGGTVSIATLWFFLLVLIHKSAVEITFRKQTKLAYLESLGSCFQHHLITYVHQLCSKAVLWFYETGVRLRWFLIWFRRQMLLWKLSNWIYFYLLKLLIIRIFLNN